MCLAIPSKIVKIENTIGTIDAGGVKKEISLLLLENARIGDYVIVHAGFAIHKIDESTAMESLKYLRELAFSMVDGWRRRNQTSYCKKGCLVVKLRSVQIDMKENYIARKLKINGLVQGVGFRPFVYNLANKFRLKGEVANNSSGVSIHIEGTRQKPFAIISYSSEQIWEYVFIEPEEEKLLNSIRRPVVLLRKKEPNFLSKEVSPNNRYFGVMLPYTPLHYLILASGFTALIMTSGNISEEPLKRILDIDPEIIACDLHLDYLSTRTMRVNSNVPKIYWFFHFTSL